MLKSLAATYRTAGAFARACPLLFLVPLLPELLQHAAEYRIGMFRSLAAARTTEHDSLRMVLGSIKILILLLPGYWVARFAWLGSGAAARAMSGVRTYLPVFLFNGAANLGALWLPLLIGGAVASRIAMLCPLALLLMGTLIAQWVARAPLGAGQPGPIASILAVGRIFLWALLFSVIAILPPMIAHYVLNFLGLGKSPGLLAMVLAADAIVVCYLTAVICIVPVEISRRAEAEAVHQVVLQGA